MPAMPGGVFPFPDLTGVAVRFVGGPTGPHRATWIGTVQIPQLMARFV
jgi:hypothetical protein